MNKRKNKLTKKDYREYLNEQHPFDKNIDGKGKGGRYKPTKRGYGDYLYSADKEMFDAGYEEWLKTGV